MFEIISGKIAKAQKVVIYGPEGIGKSTLASQFPDPLFSDIEGSTNNMDVKRFPMPTSYSMAKQQIQFIKANQTVCKTLVVDTADWLEKLIAKEVCAANNWQSIESPGYGKGYVYLAEETGRFLNMLSDLIDIGINVVILAHSQIIKFEQPDEMGAYDRYTLKMEKKTAPLYKEWADMLLFLNYKTYSVAADKDGKKHKAQGGQRTVYTTHHPAWDAKNRHSLPDEFPMDFNQIAHIFYPPAGVQEPVVEPQPIFSVNQPPLQQNAQQQPVVENVTPVVEQPMLPVQPTEAPAEIADPLPQSTPLNPAIPKSLQDLMIQNNVTEVEIQSVVSKKGYYPADTPIANYDPGFIEGVLVGAWTQVYPMIEEARLELPF